MGYSDEKNIQVLIYLLKAHDIRRIIVSPGATNVSFVASIQQDTYFNVYSAYDERSAAYMAVGMAEESGEPVVLSCTGATASRNYTSPLTEAFYKRLPVLAVTSSQASERVYTYFPQLTDRTQQYNDMIVSSTQIPVIRTNEDISYQETAINEAILDLFGSKRGPVHINLITEYSANLNVKELPKYRTIKRYESIDELPPIIAKKIGIFIGSHVPFSSEDEYAIEKFCNGRNAVVLCDHTSNYYGRHGVLVNLIADQENQRGLMDFDLIIHIGYVSGAYIRFNAKEIWRVNPDGKTRDLYHKVTKVFMMKEKTFFENYGSGVEENNEVLKHFIVKREILEHKIGDLPFSNNWIAFYTAKRIPANTVLHFGILNSLRSWNHFTLSDGVTCYSNTGGFGIDGNVSSLIGASCSNQNKLYIGVVGDLSFFYDINALSFNNISNNLRILVVNNGIGIEFVNYNHRAYKMNGVAVRQYIAAADHNSNKGMNIVSDVAEKFGFKYLRATSKNEYISSLPIFLSKSEEPIVLEAFIDENDESDSLRILNTLDGKAKININTVKDITKRLLPNALFIKVKRFKDCVCNR